MYSVNRMPHCKKEILMVEDNLADARLTMEAFKEGKIDSNLHVAKDGVQALEFLRQQSPYNDAPRPDLILLDLNLPRMNGKEVLEHIKNDEDLKCIPVIVLTTSKEDRDIDKCYQLYANCYLNKPADLDDYMSLIQLVDDFWLSAVRLPNTAC